MFRRICLKIFLVSILPFSAFAEEAFPEPTMNAPTATNSKTVGGHNSVNLSSATPFVTTNAPNFLAATQDNTQNNPPDTMGDVGPSQVILLINGYVRSFNKQGLPDDALNTTMDKFFKVNEKVERTTDPRIRYDRQAGRWYAIAITIPLEGTEGNSIVIAVSRNKQINSLADFTHFRFKASAIPPARADPNDFADFPTLGIDKNALYIGVNVFDSVIETFKNSDAFVINKAQLNAGKLFVTAFRNLLDPKTLSGPVTPQGVDNFNPNPTQGFFIGVDGQFFGKLMVRIVSNPGSLKPTISGNISVANMLTTSQPVSVPAKGNPPTDRLDPIDWRLTRAHIRGTHLYTAENIGVTKAGIASTTAATRTGSRWYQINMTTPTAPVLSQAGILYDPAATTSPLYYWVPSVMTNGVGSLLLGCSTSSDKTFINAVYALRFSNDPAGSLRKPMVYAQGTTPYIISQAFFGSGSDRWGDYSTIGIDPVDDLTFWSFQQYCSSNNVWGIRVLALRAQPPASLVSISPTSISASKKTPTTVTITGQRVNGSAFYNTPAGGDFKRMVINFSNKVKVVKIVSVTPTEIKVNVIAEGAVPGTPSVITITNPDGQSVNSTSTTNLKITR